MQEQFTKRFTFNPASSDSVGLSTSLLWEYLLTEDTIDGVVSQRIEEFALD
jgi:hypothetical protein